MQRNRKVRPYTEDKSSQQKFSQGLGGEQMLHLPEKDFERIITMYKELKEAKFQNKGKI